MKCYIDFFAFALTIISQLIFSSCDRSVINDRPIIGIVTEEAKPPVAPNASLIAASYVKFVEAGGARVVPILLHKPEKYYEDLMTKINGILFPGGVVLLNGPGYGRAGKIIFDIAAKMNDRGDYFPLWGTCLGFELLSFLAVEKNWMKACTAMDMPSNINFTKGFENSKIFKDLDNSVKNTMMNENVAIHYHKWCLTPYNFSISHLNKYFKVLATNKDSNGMDFISIIEAYKYPFYGIAFHPEKVLFEWVYSKTHQNTPHTAEAVKVSQYFSRFFVNEARKSSHRFPSKKEEDAVLIYNYSPVFTGKKKSSFEQIYYFY